MDWTRSCRNFGYISLWALSVMLVTATIAILVPSFVVLWFTFGQHHQHVDQYVVRMVNEYDIIVISTMSLMLCCMFVDISRCLFGIRTSPLRLYLCLWSKISRTSEIVQNFTHQSNPGPIPSDQSDTTKSTETLMQGQDWRRSFSKHADFEDVSVATAEMSLEALAVVEDLETDLAVQGLRINRLEGSPYVSQVPREPVEALSNRADRVETEAEQAAIANEIHRLLHTDIPNVDPYFAPADREKFESWMEEAEDVGILGEMVTEWLRKRDDLQSEKDRLLLSFHMRGLDSTSRLCAQHDQGNTTQ